MSSNTTRLLQDWSFTQIGGGKGSKDGEWLTVSQFPTTVHVELLKLNRIPDPVGIIYHLPHYLLMRFLVTVHRNA